MSSPPNGAHKLDGRTVPLFQVAPPWPAASDARRSARWVVWMKTALAVASVLWFVGCCGHQTPRAHQEHAANQTAARQPGLTRNQVLQLFRDRATPDRIREFERLRSKNDPDSQEQALKLVLFQLKDEELRSIGVLPSISLRPNHWLICRAPCGAEVNEALARALQPQRITTEVVGVNLLICVFDVPREDFFRARRALLSATNLNALGVVLLEPMFTLE